MLQKIAERLKAAYPESIITVLKFRDEITLHVKKEDIVAVCRFLHDDLDCGFDYLSDICGADAFTEENRFEVIYNLYALSTKQRLRLKIFVDENDMHVPTVTTVWAGAEWPERETFDMFGIIFDGNPDLRRIYLPEEFEYYPLRKDFPLMGIPDSLHLPRK